MFRERPSLPKYTVMYDANLVLDFIKSQKGYMSFEMLTKCLVTLLCLLCGQRVQTMAALCTDYMYVDDEKVIFYIPTLLKTTRPVFHQKPLELVAYPDEDICPVSFIKRYLKETGHLRTEGKKGFFLSYSEPYNNVTSTTLARYVKDVLNKSGIDITSFAAHSTRAASTSKVNKMLYLAEINKAAGWSSCETYAKHYNCVIDQNFGTALLDAC